MLLDCEKYPERNLALEHRLQGRDQVAMAAFPRDVDRSLAAGILQRPPSAQVQQVHDHPGRRPAVSRLVERCVERLSAGPGRVDVLRVFGQDRERSGPVVGPGAVRQALANP